MTEEEEFFFESDIFLAVYSGASYEEARQEALENLKDFREYKRANNACNRPASAVGMQSESDKSAGG